MGTLICWLQSNRSAVSSGQIECYMFLGTTFLLFFLYMHNKWLGHMSAVKSEAVSYKGEVGVLSHKRPVFKTCRKLSPSSSFLSDIAVSFSVSKFSLVTLHTNTTWLGLLLDIGLKLRNERKYLVMVSLKNIAWC